MAPPGHGPVSLPSLGLLPIIPPCHSGSVTGTAPLAALPSPGRGSRACRSCHFSFSPGAVAGLGAPSRGASGCGRCGTCRPGSPPALQSPELPLQRHLPGLEGEQMLPDVLQLDPPSQLCLGCLHGDTAVGTGSCVTEKCHPVLCPHSGCRAAVPAPRFGTLWGQVTLGGGSAGSGLCHPQLVLRTCPVLSGKRKGMFSLKES